jgi:hypothetical protein
VIDKPSLRGDGITQKQLGRIVDHARLSADQNRAREKKINGTIINVGHEAARYSFEIDEFQKERTIGDRAIQISIPFNIGGPVLCRSLLDEPVLDIVKNADGKRQRDRQNQNGSKDSPGSGGDGGCFGIEDAELRRQFQAIVGGIDSPSKPELHRLPRLGVTLFCNKHVPLSPSPCTPPAVSFVEPGEGCGGGFFCRATKNGVTSLWFPRSRWTLRPLLRVAK